MKNLKNYGVQEMNTKEMENTNGGYNLIEYIAKGAGMLVGLIHTAADYYAENNVGGTYASGHYIP